MPRIRILGLSAAMAAAIALASCGGGGSSSSLSSGGGGQSIAQQVASCEAGLPALPGPGAPNQVPVIIDAGPCAYGKQSPTSTTSTVFIVGSVNIPYTSVTICIPGTPTCQTVDHVMVDTGSYGLRIMSSVLNSNLTLANVNGSGSPMVECTQFADGYAWGQVRLADVKISSELASNIPIQVIGDASSYTVPSQCTSAFPSKPTALNDVASFGANGVLGVGLFAQDCGSGCVSNAGNTLYYTCPSASGCAPSTAALASQVTNPVSKFPTDNNGVILKLPAIAAPGGSALNLAGQLIFGIGTAGNNQTTATPGAAVYNADYGGDFTSTLLSSTGYTVTTTPNAFSFIDSGSNGIYLPGTTIPVDTSAGGWFAPTAPSNIINITATVQGHGPTGTLSGNPSPQFSFDIANAKTVLFINSNTAFDGLGAPNNSSGNTGGIDYGLPFFLGKTVYIGLEPTPTAPGPVVFTAGAFSGPFWAW